MKNYCPLNISCTVKTNKDRKPNILKDLRKFFLGISLHFEQ